MIVHENEILNNFKQYSLSIFEAYNKNDIVFLKGLTGSSLSFIINSIEPKQYQFLVFNTKESAAYFYHDLNNLKKLFKHSDKELYFLTASFDNDIEPYNYTTSNIQNRAEVLDKITANSNKKIIITYASALIEKVIHSDKIKQYAFVIEKGMKLSIDTMNAFFQKNNFERSELVFEPGQFALRGGIIDVFSFSNNKPYRIELFDDEVDSIRIFNPENQFSEKHIERFTITPNLSVSHAQNKTNLLDFLNIKKHAVWLQDIDFLKEHLEQLESKLQNHIFGSYDKNTAIEKLSHYSLGSSIIAQIIDNKPIVFDQAQHLSNAESVAFNFLPQPSFNKNFDILTDDLLLKKDEGYKIFIFSNNEKQISRLETVFKDFNTNIKNRLFHSINIPLQKGFVDTLNRMAYYTDHEIFNRYHHVEVQPGFKLSEQYTLKELQSLKIGDYVTHIDHGVGRFGGLKKIDINGKIQEAIRLIYKDNDVLYVNIHAMHRISKYSGKDGKAPKIHKLGSQTWSNLKKRTKSKVKDIAADLIKLYAQRKQAQAFEFSADTQEQYELESSFFFDDTPDQTICTQDVKKDMEASYPMDRLICGDVGFGKTEIAIRAAFKAVCDAKQVAVLAPTTILTMQHYHTFKQRLKEFDCTIDYLNRFKTTKEIKQSLTDLKSGKTDILIGTHRIVSKDVAFNDLGLLIIDEEQKFGVSTKEKLRQMTVHIDTLTLTATPIPRTLQFSLMGARDISVIKTPPPNRYPVQTELHTFNEEMIKHAIIQEVSRNGQVYFINNRVKNIFDMANKLQSMCPGVRFGVGHGQMEGKKLEKVMLDFIEGEFDVLLATTIVESGLDIPNANTIIINDAQNFGLSDLHQLRGRVGRSNKKAYCYLIAPPHYSLPDEAQKRLKAIEQYAGLGSGFNIAMRDLDIRGAGNVLGAEQSGFINEMGFETYQKVLKEAIFELKETEFKTLFENAQKLTEKTKKQPFNFVDECAIDTDFELFIPDSYVRNTHERLKIYKDINALNSEHELEIFINQLSDRYGRIPEIVTQLADTIKLKWIAIDLNFEKLILKNKKMLCYFITNQESMYYQSPFFIKTMQYIQLNPLNCILKDKGDKLILVFDNVKKVTQGIDKLSAILSFLKS